MTDVERPSGLAGAMNPPVFRSARTGDRRMMRVEAWFLMLFALVAAIIVYIRALGAHWWTTGAPCLTITPLTHGGME